MSIAPRLYNILRDPLTTEKTVANSYVTFKVDPTANKHEIKSAVEALFSVTVKSVKTLNVKGKSVNFKRKSGNKKNWKKAYVILMPGQEIDLGKDL